MAHSIAALRKTTSIRPLEAKQPEKHDYNTTF